MTVVAPGAQLAPVDLPPPHPAVDPREPSPVTHTRTPQRHRSPRPSRSSSPNPSGYPVGDASATPPPLLHPRPLTSSSPSPGPGPAAIPHAASAHHHAAHSFLAVSRPGSPSSIHSSGSAIFERDIELPAVASLSLAGPQTLSHKPSRVLHHGSALEHSVPAVLDDAVEALAGAGPRPLDGLEIEAPAPAAATAAAMARQSSSSLPARPAAGSPDRSRSLSRSSSPASAFSGSPLASPRSPPILGQLALQQAAAAAAHGDAAGPASPTHSTHTPHRPPMATRASMGPQLPGGWVREAPERDEAGLGDESPAPPHPIPAHLTPTKEKRRISFISYNDLLLSVPTTVTSLGEIASGNLSPDHLPGTVSPGAGVGVGVGAGAGATRLPIQSALGDAPGAIAAKPSWETAGRGGLGFAEGEWEREGLGRGLEQRLEDLVQHGA
ncbi:hypothetical protein Q5752_005133 [Cryptotrichosporon argae]